MAFLASNDRVRAFEQIASIALVVEPDQFPVDGIVTSPALGAKPALVLLVLMARDASDRCRSEIGCPVAIGAGNFGMLADQREFGLIVVEHYPLPV